MSVRGGKCECEGWRVSVRGGGCECEGWRV